jgi:hypothetical protein
VVTASLTFGSLFGKLSEILGGAGLGILLAGIAKTMREGALRRESDEARDTIYGDEEK